MLYRLFLLAILFASISSENSALGATEHRTERFSLGAEAENILVWGRGTEPVRGYFDEFLPALFERTLVFETLNLPGESLEWIFTGNRGGFTVQVEERRIHLTQRYYDSFGFNEIEDEKVNASRHPERKWRESSAALEEEVNRLSVVFDHKLALFVLVNDKPVLEQTCCLDVSRHQLRIGSDKAEASGELLIPKAGESRSLVQIDTSRRYQKMIGFGGIATPTAYAQLSPEGKRRWWELVSEYNLLIQREYPIGTRLNREMNNWDVLDFATPHYYGDNFPNGEISDFDYIKTLRKLGGNVWFEFWALPPWATQDWRDSEGKLHKGVGDPDIYARAMVQYCKTSVEKAGAPPDVVGIQNERHQPPEIWHQMTRTLRRELDSAGFDSVRIHMSDSGSLEGGIERARAFRKSEEVWEILDYVATHMYDYQSFFTRPDDYDARLREWKDVVGNKPFLSTELCINRPRYQFDTYRVAFTMGQLYHKNLTLTNASAICYCWTLLNVVQPSYGATRSLCVPDRTHGFIPAESSHQLRVFGAYSRHVHKGMVRVEANSNDPDLLVTAFSDDSGRITVVLINRSVDPKNVIIKGQNCQLPIRELTDCYHKNASIRAHAPGQTTEVDVLIQPGSIYTLSNVPLHELPDRSVIQ